ncbi:MAG: hypothetical protein IJ253_06065 [Bacteroidaceae bacterium]|nr:hypothetical protein [Bacteroidaceae bacterium]
MNTYKIAALALGLCQMATISAQRLTVHGRDGETHTYEIQRVDSILFLTAEDSEQYATTTCPTLWTLISQAPELSRFADIASATGFHSSVGVPRNLGVTFADILRLDIPMEVYAPTNDALSESEYRQWMALCQRDGERVQREFLAQHIALSLDSAEHPVLWMLNGKHVAAADLHELRAAPAENGTLHFLSQTLPYRGNLRELLDGLADDYTQFRAYLSSRDTCYLDMAESLVGFPDANGQTVVLDSVLTQKNTMAERDYLPQSDADTWLTVRKGFGADIASEHESFGLVLPADAVWNEACTRMAPHYVYAPSYEDRVKGNQGTTSLLTVANPDSLSLLSLKMDLASSLLFPLNAATQADTVWNTRRERLAGTAQWQVGSLFAKPVGEATNGRLYSADTWPLPHDFMVPDVDVEVNADAYYYMSSDKFYVGTGTQMTVDRQTFAAVTDRYGRVSQDGFFMMRPKGTVHPKGEIKLRGNGSPETYVPQAEVMSGTYDVYVVMVPYWYQEMAEYTVTDWEGDHEVKPVNPDSLIALYTDPHYVDSVAARCKNKFKVQVRYNNGDRTDAVTKAVEVDYDARRVDTLLVAEDVTFPYSYKNLRNSYPTLIIQGSATSANLRTGYIRNLCIDRVILKPKDNN